MRTIKFVAAGAVLLLALSLNARLSNRVNSEGAGAVEEIEQLEKTDAIAARTNDVELLTSLWTDDGVLIQPMMSPIIGRANIRALLQEQKRQAAGVETLTYVEDWTERQILGKDAFEWGTITARMRFPNGKEATQSVYVARLLVKSGGSSWRFARAIITPASRTQETPR